MLTLEAANAIAAAWAVGFTNLGNGGDVTDLEKIFAHRCKWTAAKKEAEAGSGSTSGTRAVMYWTKDAVPMSTLDLLLRQLQPYLPCIAVPKKTNFKGIKAFQAPLLQKQNFAYSQAACRGVLGDTCLLDFRRFRCRHAQSPECYEASYALLTVDDDGLICEVLIYGDAGYQLYDECTTVDA